MPANHYRLLKFLDLLAFILSGVAIVAIPFVTDTSLVNSFVLSKHYIAGLLVMLVVVIWSLRTVLLRKVAYYKSVLDIPIVALLSAGLLASIFSVAPRDSFLGRSDYFVLSFTFLLFGSFFYFITTQFTTTLSRWLKLVDTFVGVGGVLAAFFLGKTMGLLDIFSRWLPGAWSSVDQANNALAIFLTIIFLTTLGQIIKKNSHPGRTVYYSIVAILAFLSILAINFNTLWWLMLVGLLLLLFVGCSFLRETRLSVLCIVFALLIASVIFIVFGSPKIAVLPVPPEAVLGNSSSWTIASDNLFSGIKNAVFGSGPGTFTYSFSKFRSADFNNDQYAWSLRFTQPFSTAVTLVSEMGLAFSFLWVFLVIFVVGLLIATMRKIRSHTAANGMVSFFDDEEQVSANSFPYLEVALLSVPWLVLSTGMLLFFYGATLWWLWWALLGLVVVGLAFCNNKIIKLKKYAIEDTPEYTLVFSFVVIVVVAGLIITSVWGARLYMGEKKYAAGIRAQSSELSEKLLQEAIAYRHSSENYHVALAQVYLLRATGLSRAAKPDIQAIGGLVEKAVNEARLATDLAPRSVAVWENLAVMYENAAVLIPEAREWAIKSLNQARELEPTNPVLAWKLGNNYGANSKWADAIKLYEEAVMLKRDYLEAYSGLATAYEQTKDLNKAIEIYSALAQVQPNNPEALYNFGRLLYNRNGRGDRDQAEKIWLAALQYQPNYSNAIYSLGLLYESRGERTKALQYYLKVQQLNPTNTDVKNKVNSLSR